MTGILNTLSLANLDSNIVMLTDASLKDVERMDETIAKATKLQNSVHFFSAMTVEFEETYGIVVHEIEDFEAFTKFSHKVGKFNTENHLGKNSSKERRQIAI